MRIFNKTKSILILVILMHNALLITSDTSSTGTHSIQSTESLDSLDTPLTEGDRAIKEKYQLLLNNPRVRRKLFSQQDNYSTDAYLRTRYQTLMLEHSNNINKSTANK